MPVRVRDGGRSARIALVEALRRRTARRAHMYCRACGALPYCLTVPKRNGHVDRAVLLLLIVRWGSVTKVEDAGHEKTRKRTGRGGQGEAQEVRVTVI